MHDALFEHRLEGLADVPQAMQGIIFGKGAMLDDELDLAQDTFLRLPFWQNSMTM